MVLKTFFDILINLDTIRNEKKSLRGEYHALITTQSPLGFIIIFLKSNNQICQNSMLPFFGLFEAGEAKRRQN